MIFQGSSVARNCVSPETVPSTILGIERRFCVISKKLLRAAFLWEKKDGL